MNAAITLYNEFCDIDHNDYNETISNDIQFIQELIKEYGIKDARKILKAYFD